VEVLEPLFNEVKREEIKDYGTELVNALIERFKKFSEEDMNEIDKITTEKFFSIVDKVLAVTIDGDSADAKASIKLVIIKKYLISDNLKKKIEAIATLKENYKIPQIIKESTSAFKKLKERKCEPAIQALKEIEFIKLLFKKSPQKELIKAGELLIRLLVISDNFEAKDTEVMLDCYRGNYLIKYRIT